MEFSIHFSFQIMILPWLRQKSNKLTLKRVPAQFFHLMVHKRFLQKLQQKCSNCRYFGCIWITIISLLMKNASMQPLRNSMTRTVHYAWYPYTVLQEKKNMQTAMENLLAISSSWISVIEKSSVLFKRKGITNYGIVTWNYFGAS